MARRSTYPPIADYAMISDCHTAALVSMTGSVDWMCMPRFDSGSVVGRLLDWKRGGYCSIAPDATGWSSSRRYVDGTLVLETTFDVGGDEVRLHDCLALRAGDPDRPFRQLLRVVEGIRGRTPMRMEFSPRFDYGEVRPWIRRLGPNHLSAIGGDDAVVVWTDTDLDVSSEHDIRSDFTLRAGERVRFSFQFVRPETIDAETVDPPSGDDVDRRLKQTIAWWRRWSGRIRPVGAGAGPLVRSAVVLKGLTNARTGAMAAAPTTSLPEVVGGSRNWDYRYSWVRDSTFSVMALAELGCDEEADGFRRFIERTAAGNAEDLQVVFGPGGERRLVETELDLAGYRRSKPVRIGNGAARQLQLDVFGELVQLSWLWHRRGHSPDDDYWRFIVALVDAAASLWNRPDSGIWEIRDNLEHFVHSKAMCWVALARGLDLARECARKAPERRWREARDRIRRAVESRGYDRSRGIFVRSFGSRDVDAALLLLPIVGFVDYQDERMLRTADAIRESLEVGPGLVLRFRDRRDREQPREGAFLACSFWLAEVLARQDRTSEAEEVFDAAMACANDLGLFSEQFDPKTGTTLGNFPQALTHLSHISAALAVRPLET
ncbi:MAG: glycoside hydrolase family 15 protein [Actinomycetota bacterium]